MNLFWLAINYLIMHYSVFIANKNVQLCYLGVVHKLRLVYYKYSQICAQKPFQGQLRFYKPVLCPKNSNQHNLAIVTSKTV